MAERITGSQQENLLAILGNDDKHGGIVARLVNPDLFEGDYRLVAERFCAYWRKHKKPPGVHAADLFADILEQTNNRKARTFERILRNTQLLSEDINAEYVMGALRSFTRLQEMKDAILKAAEKLQAGGDETITEVEAMLDSLLRARVFEFDAGLTLDRVDHIVSSLETQASEFRFGIDALDRKYISPIRGGTVLCIAPTGRGKSWFLVNTGKHALLQRKRVLHVTLEMSDVQVAQRYYQALFAMTKREATVRTTKLESDDHGFYYETGGDEEYLSETHFEMRHVREHMRKMIKPWMKRIPYLQIKRFPPRSLTMDGLRSYLDRLEQVNNFIPDMIILDYIGICSTDEKNHRISLGRLYEEFRAVIIERNAAGITAHQSSRMGAMAESVKSTDVAEDWSLIATSDVALTYSQTDAEEKFGLARLMVAKARDEEDKFGAIVTQSYKSGQFALQSALLNKDYWRWIKEERRTDEDDDDEDKHERKAKRSRDDDGDDDRGKRKPMQRRRRDSDDDD